jgi:hypothetical protein
MHNCVGLIWRRLVICVILKYEICMNSLMINSCGGQLECEDQRRVLVKEKGLEGGGGIWTAHSVDMYLPTI